MAVIEVPAVMGPYTMVSLSKSTITKLLPTYLRVLKLQQWVILFFQKVQLESEDIQLSKLMSFWPICSYARENQSLSVLFYTPKVKCQTFNQTP